MLKYSLSLLSRKRKFYNIKKAFRFYAKGFFKFLIQAMCPIGKVVTLQVLLYRFESDHGLEF